MKITNCKNCGAVMEYSKQYYGSMYKCPYCKTEHHIDKLGRIEDYKIKFMWQGHLIEAYLEEIDVSYPEIDCGRSLIDGHLIATRIERPILNFKFMSINIEDLPEKQK